ncbi:MAG TPA: Stk1 family PASTA domain-containing Ser/Thr kinase [Candidatus Faecousia intestinigallinarum]|nr:Stk1 family PASTA domain-containing Ser/Thr kinase [Candidatus Faecousia intestinigallinarum]
MDTDKYIGRLLDNRYEILEVIGTGGMAVVYKARCHRLNRLVAVKILKDEYSQDEEFRRRFHAEGQAVAMLSHPNIVSVYDVSTSLEADYIVMELIDGISLKQYMEKKGILNWKETLHFAMQIAKALEHAHSRGIVHRDIKPHNVMVLKNGSVKVADFGIARIMSKGNTLTKEALGSVHYISPEQAKGSRVDNRSDIYSLGVVMYEMMAGRPPFDGESPVAVAIQHINGGAPLPSTLNPNIPGGLEQIIMKAMAHDPNDRYDSATAMLYDMEEFRKDPAIRFQYDTGDMDAALHLTGVRPQEQAPAHPRTTAERVADRRGEPPRVHREQTAEPAQRKRETAPARSGGSTAHAGTGRTPAGRESQRRREEEEKRNRITTIAIVACSAVAVLAIVVFLVVLFGSGVGSEEKMVQVPALLGENFEELPTYADLQITLRERMYSDEYEKDQIMGQTPNAGEMVVENTVVYVDVSLGEEPLDKTMENLVGMEQSMAENFLEGQGIVPMIRQENSPTVTKGRIIRTDPFEGQPLEDGQTVTLWVSTGMMEVPNVEGMNETAAVEKLAENGFKNVEIEEVDSDRPSGEVINQSLRAHTEADVTTEVTLEVSSGVVKRAVPNVVGDTLDEARRKLAEMGFDNVKEELVDNDAAENTVVRQSINPDTLADIKSQIVLQISKGPTEPPTTVPTTPPAVTKTVTFGLLEGHVEEYTVSIRLNDQVIHEQTIADGGSYVQLELTGSGVVYYDVYINGKYFQTQKVDFTS